MMQKHLSFKKLTLSVILSAMPLLGNANPSSITSFTIVNADTDIDIATSTTEGKVDSNTPINIRANVQTAGSVEFSNGKTENSAPFAYMGDNRGNYQAWKPAPGTYVIKATAFSQTNGKGTKLSEATFTLTVESKGQSTTTPTYTQMPTSKPTPTPTSTQMPTSKPTPTPTSTPIPTSNPSSNPPVGELPNVFATQCVACHGVNGSGGRGGKLTNYSKGHTLTQMTNVIRKGKGSMPAYPATAVSDADIKLIYAFFSGNSASTAAPTTSPSVTPTPTSRPTPTPTSRPTPTPTTSTPSPTKTPDGAYSGNLIIDPDSMHHFVYDRDDNGDNERDAAYLAGSGGPEGFLYESQARRTEIINKLLSSTRDNNLGPVNGIYFHSMRSYGGDASGDNTQTPFVNNLDPFSGLSPQKMDSWRADLERLDNAGVILWFTLFDDHAAPYGCQFNDDYKKYAVDLVNEFKHLKNLIWVTQEEYRWTDRVGGSSTQCPTQDSVARQKGLANAIRSADPIHAIATHHMGGSDFEFANDPTIKVFGQQSKANTPQQMHDTSGKQGWGNRVYVMAECHPWHKDLLNMAGGAGRTLMRQSNWATAMSGGYVMMYDAFEGGEDPSIDILDDLRRLRNFMESAAFNKLSPLFDTALQQAKLAGTNYILANQSQGMYLLYGYASAAQLGINNITSGNYQLRWLDVITGDVVEEQQGVSTSSAVFTKPSGFSNEVALYLVKQP